MSTRKDVTDIVFDKKSNTKKRSTIIIIYNNMCAWHLPGNVNDVNKILRLHVVSYMRYTPEIDVLLLDNV
jgi:hypothetical protein